MEISTKELYNGLDTMYAIADRIDDEGGGVKALSNGRFATRDALQADLLQFLYHIVSRSSVLTQAQADVLSIILGFDPLLYEVEEKARSCAAYPSFDEAWGLTGLLMEDLIYTQEEGQVNTKRSDLFYNLCGMFGDIMLLAGDRSSHAVGSMLKERYLTSLKQYSYNWIIEHNR